MFSLVIVIIAIALVAALALATIYYGGTALSKSSGEAISARALNEGNQVVGALELYRAEHGALPTGTATEIKATLVSGQYLQAWPAEEWEPRNDYVVRTGLTHEACQAVNLKLGLSTVPSCTDSAFSARTVCCETP